MQQLRTELQQIAAHPSPVLLVGEPGSGREAFARYLHEQGPRANAPFVPLVASGLREADAEARLFGREEPDGTKVAGVLEEAGNGTLFITRARRPAAGVQRLLVGVLRVGPVHAHGRPRAAAAARAPAVLGAAGYRTARRSAPRCAATCSRT